VEETYKNMTKYTKFQKYFTMVAGKPALFCTSPPEEFLVD
jgi:hypothetical protein